MFGGTDDRENGKVTLDELKRRIASNAPRAESTSCSEEMKCRAESASSGAKMAGHSAGHSTKSERSSCGVLQRHRARASNICGDSAAHE